MRILFVGLGVMGGPMAGHIQKAGHAVLGYNRSHQKAHDWAKATGGEAVDDLVSAAQKAEAVILCVGRDEDVSALVTQILPALKSDCLIIDHTTTSARLADEMAQLCSSGGVYFCDAPVSGGQAGAVNGALSLMVGCPQSQFSQLTQIIAPYTKSIVRIGDVGSGQKAKMANQIAIAGLVQGLAEALHFTKCAGLDPDLVFAAISKGAAGSWQMDNRWPSMTEGRYDFGFAVDWMRKDLGIALAESQTNGAKLEVAALVDQFYAEVQAMGGARWDTSSLHARLEAKRNRD
jgi:3-hydroxyisobutyrate dehydrogenase-like beta-hydroxyacid dehydrogenase